MIAVTMRSWLLASAALLLLSVSGCMGRGAAGRAAALPQPTSLAQWLAIAVFVIAIWWIAMKILRG
jgi:hypothetical protein